MTRDFFISIKLQMPCPSIGSKLFWTGPHILDRFQNVKFSSKKLFLVWSKTFWRIQNVFGLVQNILDAYKIIGPIEGQSKSLLSNEVNSGM